MYQSEAISRELTDMVRRELEEDEKIVWMERPRPRFFTSEAKIKFFFGIPIMAFVAFWIYGASGSTTRVKRPIDAG